MIDRALDFSLMGIIGGVEVFLEFLTVLADVMPTAEEFAPGFEIWVNAF